MKQLSGLDATFLYLETPEMPMHVGALHVLELPAGFRGRFVTALRKHIAERLPEVPVLRRKLWRMPLNMANPAWVDAEPDLRQHIVELRLPPSARHGDGVAALEAQVALLHPVLLDRDRPLWKFHVLEGLAPTADGCRRVGLYSQLHHAAVDGQAAVALGNAIFDPTPQPRAPQTGRSRRGRVFRLEMTEMLRSVIGNQAQQLAGIVRRLPATVGTLKDAAGSALSRTRLFGGQEQPSNLTLAPRTAFNASVTTGRAYATASLPLNEVKAIGHAFDATVNEMVLMLCSSALRRCLTRRRTLPRKSLVAAVPVSLRAAGDTTADNQASMSFVSLGTHLADTRRRLAHVRAASAAMKSALGSVRSILPTDYPSLGVPWLLEAATALVGRSGVIDRLPQVANLVISNVPGPPVALYLAGARVRTIYPTSIVVHGLALNITVQSFDQSLDFGLMADAQALPEVHELAQALHVALDDLRALPRPGEPDPDAPPPEGLVRRTTRKLAGGLGEAVGGMVGGAVGSVVSQVARQVVDRALERAQPAPSAAPAAKPRRRMTADDSPEVTASVARSSASRRSR